MADLTIADVRAKYPAYNDMSDEQLAGALHSKFYADMPFDTFAEKIGYSAKQPDAALLPMETATNVPATTEKPEQGTVGALLNAAAQGVMSGVGGAIAGAGEFGQQAGSAERVLKAVNFGDTSGLSRDESRLARVYAEASPEQQESMRGVLRQQATGTNPVTEAGKSVQEFGKRAFPIASENEGFGTKAAGFVGGALPIMAGLVANPIAGFAAAASQAYDSVFNDATAKGATPEEAETAAGRTALAQGAAMVTPVGRILQRIPMNLRDEFGRTLVGLAQSGMETGTANALATLAGNFIASHSYDPSRSLLEGVGEAFATAAAGGPIVHGIAGAARGVMGAKNVDQAIQAANDAAGTGRPDVEGNIARVQAQIGARPQSPPTPDVTAAPSFVPPGSDVPVAARLTALAREDQRMMANQPDQIPPTTSVGMTGEATPLQRPPVDWAAGGPATVPSWGDLFAQGKVEEPPAVTGTALMPSVGAGPFVPGSAGVPVSAGAAASREGTPASMLVETPAQRATALQKMINQTAEDRITPEGRDDAVYVEGVERPEAMRDFSPAQPGELSTALAHKALYNTDSNYHDQFDAQVKKNNTIMVDKMGDLIRDANARDAAMEHAKELMPGPVGLFVGEKPVNAQPIVDQIHDILAGPAGKRSSVKGVLEGILPKLYDADGKLEDMPSMLKGIRDDITDKLYDKTPTTEGNAARTARNQLNSVLNVVDNTIGEGLPGTKFQDYLTNLSAALGEVSKLDYLQSFITGSRKITNLAGDLQFNKVQKMLEDIQQHHADLTGGAKELSIEEINQIEAVRNELAAKDLLDRRAGVRGSPTVQIGTASGVFGNSPTAAAVRGAAEVALHAGLVPVTGGLGNAALLGYRYILKPGMEAARIQREAAERETTKQRLLDVTPRPEP